MLNQKIIASFIGGAISLGTVCYTYETFRFDNVSHIYKDFNYVIEKYELMKENRDDLIDKYNNLYHQSTEKIHSFKQELNEKETYIKTLEEKINKLEDVISDKQTQENESSNQQIEPSSNIDE